ncbi:hypothetical protein CKM354_001033900 [Cercospora kikuchii]|uniref:Bicarbonate transporter-like transmembrane domain-containing protein n=1 Tax=Cercospora kikuchii TaxID=84275 RepID=A0A9P3CTE3_9PEZI|nr:uncharacterized protein CKM354_001033900 [Cercospora kikuchii]GIZ47242.1 hypothetical protein CKM354_001033900 [Cercospora kikuchii]
MELNIGRGIRDDIRRRLPFYWSDWKDAWNYRTIPAVAYMYFANLLPALAFSFDMFARTNDSFGVNEVLLAQVIGCCVYSVLAAQPLVIVGVTGPIAIFAYTIYDIVTPQGYDYFVLWAWIGIWSFILHAAVAILNACNTLTYVTKLPCDTFGLYIAFVYLQKAVQILLLQWEYTESSPAAPYLSIMVALLVMVFGFSSSLIGSTRLFRPAFRKVIEDYGLPLTVVFFSGFVHIGKMRSVSLEVLPIAGAFSPTADRSWLIPFWKVDAATVFYALPYAIAVTILFYFDHNVSALMSQGAEFPLRKPPGFHWDYFLLGGILGLCGILGLPFPNGLIPQGPLHTKALAVYGSDLDEKGHRTRVIDHIVEQRVSHLSQGLLFLATMSGPILTALHQIPQAVLSGLFIVMGLQTLMANGVVAKLVWISRDRETISSEDPLLDCRKVAVRLILGLQLGAFVACFAVTQTIAAIAFPIIIVLMIPCRIWLLPRLLTNAELEKLDGPVASEFVMQSVGGNAKL